MSHTTVNVLISCVRWLFHILFTVYVNVIMMELPFVIGAVYRYYESRRRILNDVGLHGLRWSPVVTKQTRTDSRRPRRPMETTETHGDHWRPPKSGCSRHTKIRVFKATIESVLLYGAETWTLTEQLTSRICGTYTKLLRKALNVSWRDRITNA